MIDISTNVVAAEEPHPNNIPVRVEHEYLRKGAFNLFAAFNTRTGEVTGIFRRRKRQLEFLELLEKIDAETPAHITKIHLVCDNVSIHKGKVARAWLAANRGGCEADHASTVISARC